MSGFSAEQEDAVYGPSEGWVKKVAPPCKHPNRPRYERGIEVGSTWRCGQCSQLFRVDSIKYATDQRDDNSFVWKPVTATGGGLGKKQPPYYPPGVR